MENAFSRTEILIGSDAMKKLSLARVAVFGVGGVGGYAVEALARSGVGAIDVIDGDTVSLTNINRQIIATNSTVGRYKTEVAAERVKDINPACKVTAHKLFYTPENCGEIDFGCYSYIVDAIDTVTCKLDIIENAKRLRIPVISCMGAGNKLNPAAFEVADIEKTSVCPLARVMRRELKKRGISGVKVVFSRELPATGAVSEQDGGKTAPASISFVPPAAGFIAAGEVIKDLLGIR